MLFSDYHAQRLWAPLSLLSLSSLYYLNALYGGAGTYLELALAPLAVYYSGRTCVRGHLHNGLAFITEIRLHQDGATADFVLQNVRETKTLENVQLSMVKRQERVTVNVLGREETLTVGELR